MTADQLKQALCSRFCDDLRVCAVPDGFAVSTEMATDAGDRIFFFVRDQDGAIVLSDDGEFLATLEARGIDVGSGQRAQFIDGILASADARWDRETFEIRTGAFEPPFNPRQAVAFLTALVRVRDVRFWTREAVRSTFKDDVTAVIQETFGKVAHIETDSALHADLSEFPADVVLRPKDSGRTTGIYLVTSNDGLNEALALWQEKQRLGHDDLGVVAIVEDHRAPLSDRKKQRTQNRIESFLTYRGDEKAVLDRLGKTAGLKAA